MGPSLIGVSSKDSLIESLLLHVLFMLLSDDYSNLAVGLLSLLPCEDYCRVSCTSRIFGTSSLESMRACLFSVTPDIYLGFTDPYESSNSMFLFALAL